MKLIRPSKIKGKVSAPLSKSVAQRAILCALFSEKTEISLVEPLCNDIKSALRCFEALGGVRDGETLIGPKFKQKKVVLEVGESGFLARTLPFIAHFFCEEFEIKSEGTLTSRKIDPPFLFKGAGVYVVDNILSSQYVSGLLISLSQSVGESKVKFDTIPSLPYLELSAEIINSFGGNVTRVKDGYVVTGKNGFNKIKLEVEGDWSGVSNFLVLGALAGEVSALGLKLKSSQGDKNILKVLEDFGAEIDISNELVTVKRSQNRSFIYDATDTPDLVPVLAVLASKANGISEIKGIQRLAGKESDRDRVILEAFKDVGVLIDRVGDSFFITGGEVKGGRASSYSDHRIAMALAALGVVSKEGVEIIEPDCVSKSYPTFFCSLTALSDTITS